MMHKRKGMSEADWLFHTRSMMKAEAQNILDCRNENDRQRLAWEWKHKYSPTFVAELIRLFKNKRATIKIANWNLAQFERERIRNS